jgi:hypothetical protein
MTLDMTSRALILRKFNNFYVIKIFMETKRDTDKPLIEDVPYEQEDSVTQARVLDTNFAFQGGYFSGQMTKDSDAASFVNTCEITDLFDGFNWFQYYEFVFYHFMFLFVTGPLTGYLLEPLTGKFLMQNLKFKGLNAIFYFQTLTWFTWASLLSAYFFYFNQNADGTSNILFPLQLYLMASVMVVRILSVSVKYGTFSKCKLNRWKTEYVPFADIQKEFVLGKWQDQDDEMVEMEIRKAMHRQEIDSAVFQFSFLGELDEEVATILRLNTNYYKERSTSFFPLKEVFCENPDDKSQSDFYHGFSIMLYWIDNYKKYLTPNVKSWLRVFSVVRAFLPIVIYLIFYRANGEEFSIATVLFYLTQAAAIIFNIMNFYFNAGLIGLYLVDLKRKSFFMQQLSYLIAPKRFDGFQTTKYFPTMNILDPRNIKSWISLRKLAMSYGRRIDARLQNDLVGYLLYYIMLLLIIFFNGLSFLNPDTSVLVRVTTIYEISLMVILALSALLKASEVNNFFVIHKKILMENRIFYLDFGQKAKFYLTEENPTANYLHKFCAKRLKNDSDSSLDSKVSHLKQLNETTADAMDDLEFSQKTDSLRIFGISASNEVLVSMAIGIFSIAASTVDSLIARP